MTAIIDAGMADPDIVEALKRERAELERKLEGVNQAIATLESHGVTTSSAGPKPRVSPEKIHRVHEYLEAHIADGPIRGADLAGALGINSGEASMALTFLEGLGQVQRGPRVRRSLTWTAKQS